MKKAVNSRFFLWLLFYTNFTFKRNIKLSLIEQMDEPNHNVKLSKLIDFFNTYDSIMSDEERDENLSDQEIDDREIELLMLTLPRMGRLFKDEDGTDLSSDEIKEMANNEIKLFRRAIPRFGKRAIPRFGKRAIPRIG